MLALADLAGCQRLDSLQVVIVCRYDALLVPAHLLCFVSLAHELLDAACLVTILATLLLLKRPAVIGRFCPQIWLLVGDCLFCTIEVFASVHSL